MRFWLKVNPYFYQFLLLIFRLTLFLMMADQTLGLTAEEVNRISQGITVLIEGTNPGSGVIFSRDGNTYYVLTANHVVKTPDEYTVITADGKQHFLNYNQIIKLPGIDLAILPFTSETTYPVATLADYNYDAKAQYIFISGWPESRLPLSERRRVFTAGVLMSESEKSTIIKVPFTQGYDLFYTNITQVGMSGSPILDTDGRVIGIHGKSEGQIFQDQNSGLVSRVTVGYSAGVPLDRLFQSGLELNFRIITQPPALMTATELKSIQRFLTISPLSGGELTALDWSNRGNQFYRLKRWKEALAAFDQAIAIQANFYPAWYGRGQVLEKLEEYQDALFAYSKTTQIQPNFHLAWREKGQILMQLGDYQQALSAFDRVIQIQPDDYQVWYLRGNLLMNHLQAAQEAIKSYDQVINLKPDFAPAWTNRAIAWTHLKQHDEAILSLEQALKLDAKQEQAWKLRAEILLELQQYSQALKSSEQALILNRNNPQLWLLNAQILAKMRQYSQARVSALKALKLKPQNREILRFIRSLPLK